MLLYYIITAFQFVLITAIYWMLPNLTRPTIPFGVRIPLAHANEPAIATERRQYRTRLLLVAVLVIAAIIGFALLTDKALALTFGVVALAIAFWAVYYYSHRRLQAVKGAAGWFAGTHQVVMASTEVRSLTAAVSWPLLIVAVGLILLTAALGIWLYPALPEQLNTLFDANGVANATTQKSVLSAFIPLIVQIVLTTLLGGLVLLTGQMRQDIDVEEPAASAQQQKQLMRTFGRGLLLVAVCIDLTLLLIALRIWGLLPVDGLPVAYLALPVLLGAVGFVVMLVKSHPCYRRSGSGGAAWVRQS